MKYWFSVGPTLLLFMVFASASGCRRSPTDPGGVLAAGVWAGPAAIVTVRDDAVVIELECASGQIPQPIRVGPAGEFSVDGVYAVTRGPIQGPTEPARYSGRVAGRTTTFSITLRSTGETLGPFAVSYKATPQLVKCV